MIYGCCGSDGNLNKFNLTQMSRMNSSDQTHESDSIADTPIAANPVVVGGFKFPGASLVSTQKFKFISISLMSNRLFVLTGAI
jgi:hypothetical protein